MKLLPFLPVLFYLLSCISQTQPVNKQMAEKVLFEELTPTAFRERLAKAPVAYLPLGTIEWHGEHLPLGSDGLQSREFFIMLAREAGGIVYPMLFMGPDRKEIINEEELYGMDINYGEEADKNYYPSQQLDGSSYWISNEDFRAMMEAILKQVSRAGFKVLVAHGHGPSTGYVIDHTEEWEEKYGLKILHCWGYRDSEGMGIMVDHAAMNETSLVMALRPELVKMEYLPADTSKWPVGVGGKDPRLWASPEKGREILAIQQERMANLIAETLAKVR
jgi:creatinine amidohydrolase